MPAQHQWESITTRIDTLNKRSQVSDARYVSKPARQAFVPLAIIKVHVGIGFDVINVQRNEARDLLKVSSNWILRN